MSEYNLNDVTISSIDKRLLDLFNLCPNINFFALGGGSSPYVHILTILTICRKKSFIADSQKCLFKLLLQADSCMFNGNCSLDLIPDSISSWYSTMVLESTNKKNSKNSPLQVAERCICVALNQKRWHFVQNSQFCNQLSVFLWFDLV